jgi:hypothetical protein
MPERVEMKIGQIWRHKVRGVEYEIVSDCASIQCSAAPEFEDQFGAEYWVVYRSVRSASVWVRPKEEFLDGRFEFVREVS